MKLMWLAALAVAVGPAWAQEDGDRKQEGEKREEPAPKRREAERRDGDRPQEGERPVRRDGERKEGDRPREGERPPVRRDGERKEGERPVQREGDRPREGAREGERPVQRDGDRPREGERPRDGERPVQREGDRPREGAREGDRPRDGERREGNPRPARGEVVPPAPVESPIPVDERVVPKTETPPSFVGRVQSVFKDGVNTLLSLKVPGRTPTECSIQLQSATVVSYVGLEKPQEVPTAGYLVYVWLKPGSADVAMAARFTADSKK